MHRVQRLLLQIYRCMCVCLLDTTVRSAKAKEPIKMPFGLWTRILQGKQQYWGYDLHHYKVYTESMVSCLQCCDAVGWAAGRASGL